MRLKVTQIDLLVSIAVMDSDTGKVLLPPVDFEHSIVFDQLLMLHRPPQDEQLLPYICAAYTKVLYEMIRTDINVRQTLRGFVWALDPQIVSHYEHTILTH